MRRIGFGEGAYSVIKGRIVLELDARVVRIARGGERRLEPRHGGAVGVRALFARRALVVGAGAAYQREQHENSHIGLSVFTKTLLVIL